MKVAFQKQGGQPTTPNHIDAQPCYSAPHAISGNGNWQAALCNAGLGWSYEHMHRPGKALDAVLLWAERKAHTTQGP